METMCENPRVNVKVKPRSTFTFTSDLPYVVSILVSVLRSKGTKLTEIVSLIWIINYERYSIHVHVVVFITGYQSGSFRSFQLIN